MADKARNATDRKLSAMERQIEKIYSKSTKEITEKWKKYMENAEKRVSGLQKEYDDAVKRGDKDEIEQAKRRLDRAKYNETITNARYKEMVDQTTTRMANANIIAAAYVNGQLPEVYVLNYNQMGSGADAMGVSYTLLDENTLSRAIKGEIPRKTIDVPKDKRWNEKYINSQVTQGIIQGESMDKISKRIFPEIMSKTDFSNLTEEEKNKLIERNKQSSIRAARTMVTGVENLGRLDGMKQLEKEGVLMKKIWTSTPDDRTRESHIDIDGEEQNLDDYFSNGCMFPGDGEGPAEEVWNCRCSMRRHIIGIRRKDGTIKEVDYKADSEEHDEAIEQEKLRRQMEGSKESKSNKKTSKNAENTVKQATTRAEADAMYREMFLDIEQNVRRLDDALYIENANQLYMLNSRFGVLTGDNSGYLTSKARGSAIAYASTKYRSESYSLGLVAKYYNNADTFSAVIKRQVESGWSMPCSAEYFRVYSATHEYGHLIHYKTIKERANFESMSFGLSEEWNKHEKAIWNEVVEIAKQDNPEFTIFASLSTYGKSNSAEAFAEAFANSQCGEPNELGRAMNKWLERQGY